MSGIVDSDMLEAALAVRGVHPDVQDEILNEVIEASLEETSTTVSRLRRSLESRVNLRDEVERIIAEATGVTAQIGPVGPC